jgi:hypothetical protein
MQSMQSIHACIDCIDCIHIRNTSMPYTRARMHAHICTHTYIRTYTHTHIHTCTHTYIHTYIHIHTWMHACIYIHTHIHLRHLDRSSYGEHLQSLHHQQIRRLDLLQGNLSSSTSFCLPLPWLPLCRDPEEQAVGLNLFRKRMISSTILLDCPRTLAPMVVWIQMIA